MTKKLLYTFTFGALIMLLASALFFTDQAKQITSQFQQLSSSNLTPDFITEMPTDVAFVIKTGLAPIVKDDAIFSFYSQEDEDTYSGNDVNWIVKNSLNDGSLVASQVTDVLQTSVYLTDSIVFFEGAASLESDKPVIQAFDTDSLELLFSLGLKDLLPEVTADIEEEVTASVEIVGIDETHVTLVAGLSGIKAKLIKIDLATLEQESTEISVAEDAYVYAYSYQDLAIVSYGNSRDKTVERALMAFNKSDLTVNWEVEGKLATTINEQFEDGVTFRNYYRDNPFVNPDLDAHFVFHNGTSVESLDPETGDYIWGLPNPIEPNYSYGDDFFTVINNMLYIKGETFSNSFVTISPLQQLMAVDLENGYIMIMDSCGSESCGYYLAPKSNKIVKFFRTAEAIDEEKYKSNYTAYIRTMDLTTGLELNVNSYRDSFMYSELELSPAFELSEDRFLVTDLVKYVVFDLDSASLIEYDITSSENRGSFLDCSRLDNSLLCNFRNASEVEVYKVEAEGLNLAKTFEMDLGVESLEEYKVRLEVIENDNVTNKYGLFLMPGRGIAHFNLSTLLPS